MLARNTIAARKKFSSATPVTWATFDPANKDADVSLDVTNLIASGTDVGVVRATIPILATERKYFELELDASVGGFDVFVGLALAACSLAVNLGSTADGWSLVQDDGGYFNNGFVAQLPAYTTTAGDVIGVAFDNGSLSFYKNGSLLGGGPLFTGLAGTYYPAVSIQFNTVTLIANFGQNAWAFSPPALHTGIFN